jgi:hypothetical protein
VTGSILASASGDPFYDTPPPLRNKSFCPVDHTSGQKPGTEQIESNDTHGYYPVFYTPIGISDHSLPVKSVPDC